MADHSELKRLAEAVNQSYADLCERGGDELAEAWHSAELAYDDAANPEVVLALIAENDALREEIGGIKEISSVQVRALKALTFAARTTGGTAGPDEGLMKACEEAEQSISLGGIGRAYMAGADAAMGQGEKP